MAATPLSAPPGSPLDIQQQGQAEIRQLKREAFQKRHAPAAMVAVSSEGTVDESREQKNEEDKNWISILEQKLSREVAHKQWMIKQKTKKLDSETNEEWVERITKQYGVYPHPATEVLFSDVMPCDGGKKTVDGCVGQDTLFGHPTALNMQMIIAPHAVGDIYVLFHEIAHTKGILDECSADNYSRSITGLPGGYYC